ncbi:MAG: TetR/AcrR family transcriptional regulator [Candidatus Acidiferrum sp.]|jgi:TetR/AcrR family transcriptional repressor of nem operon
MTKGADTRREIIEKAAPLFNQKGFEGTSLSDLMRVTGLQKGGLYRHFSSKEELAGEAFDYAWQRAVIVRLHGIDEAADSVERLRKMIDNFVDLREGLVPGGCPLMNTAVEADDGNSMLRNRAKGALNEWMAKLSKTAARGIAEKEIDPRVDPKILAQVIISSLEGALLVSRLENDRSPLNHVRRHLLQYIDEAVRVRRAGHRRGRVRGRSGGRHATA